MSSRPITENTLFQGDNPKILRQYIPDESIDLIYLDPPKPQCTTQGMATIIKL